MNSIENTDLVALEKRLTQVKNHYSREALNRGIVFLKEMKDEVSKLPKPAGQEDYEKGRTSGILQCMGWLNELTMNYTSSDR